ncbi:MAG: hypothetical protein JST31_06530 [Actinobacteria bacterium]|nr:hypothetical protein [Actinomycetota bacterium]
MKRVDTRRLAAIDMHGVAGRRFRRRIILAEFVLAALGGVALGVFLLANADGGLVGILFGIWALGVGLNYVPLALHALSLRSGPALEAELAGADIGAELRYFSVTQLWVAVPFLFLWWALRPG